ncbi:murein L,D-transpeptidase YcbB/YkuD [Geothermobacter ehrlichii]|uniref:Murein L,D-transpeptidase YcbB/YkuD n=1 Tax=Geothermobacter ehrlichii TaxID=213224 RepID=A0A5D3WM11_9BACT|nr:murein L,D-transpeptidase YcbB/YkuD [Geothermobacter ehrlichii]
MRRVVVLLFLLALAPAFLLRPAPAASLPGEVAGILRIVLDDDTGAAALLPAVPGLAWGDLVRRFYRQRQFRPAWVTDLGLDGRARELIEFLRGAGDFGLCGNHYHLQELEPLLLMEADSLRHGVLFDATYFALMELLLTDAFLRLADDLSGWRPPRVQARGRIDRDRALVLFLEQSLRNGLLTEALRGLDPDQQPFVSLLEELQRLRKLSALGGWPPIPPGPVLRPGMRDSRLAVLRQRLYYGGDLEPYAAWGEENFGPLTVRALKQFQRRHGLRDDGVLGPLTLAELNRPVEERIRQIEINLWRWRRESRNYGERYLRVNIAAFRLDIIELGEIVMSMPVVVGTPYRKTPSFAATMRYLEFAPYWYVPATILREDKLPRIRRDPGWLTRHHFEIVSWRGDGERLIDPRAIDWRRVRPGNFPGILRQRPGPWNPLGRVKFMFPNRYAVYLHDTDSPHLFARIDRLFSSGCIRVERPLDLALYLLEKNGWNCERIIEAMDSPEPLRVDLDEPVPVHIVYWTAWVDANGQINYRNDVYQRDADLELAWRRRLTGGGLAVQWAGAGARSAGEASAQSRSLSQ